MFEFSFFQWLLAVISAIIVGISKCGFASLGLISILMMASLFEDKLSTGVLLPMLCMADIGAVLLFKRYVVWKQIWLTFPIACIGVILGTWLMGSVVPDWVYRPFIACTVLILVFLQSINMIQPSLFENVPKSRFFSMTMGLLAGVSTMMANAAGQIMTIYFLAVGLPKYQLAGCSAWFFLLINFYKLPFSAFLGLINSHTLLFNFMLFPAILVGLILGKRLLYSIPQKSFERFILLLTTLAAIIMLFM